MCLHIGKLQQTAIYLWRIYDTGVVYIVVLMRIRTARLRLCFAAFCKNLFHRRSYFASASACTIAAGHSAPSPGGGGRKFATFSKKKKGCFSMQQRIWRLCFCNEFQFILPHGHRLFIHALTNATDNHKYSLFPSKILPVPEF